MKKCRDCDVIVPWSTCDARGRVDFSSHDIVCINKQVNCDDCKMPMLRGEMNRHLSQECKRRRVYCDYKHLDGAPDSCRSLMEFCDKAEHMASMASVHLELYKDTAKKKFESYETSLKAEKRRFETQIEAEKKCIVRTKLGTVNIPNFSLSRVSEMKFKHMDRDWQVYIGNNLAERLKLIISHSGASMSVKKYIFALSCVSTLRSLKTQIVQKLVCKPFVQGEGDYQVTFVDFTSDELQRLTGAYSSLNVDFYEQE